MLTTATQFSPRARVLQTNRVAVRALGAASSTLLLRQRQQTRGFRYDLWSSYVDPEVQRWIRRRQKVLRHKYADPIHRRLSWEKHPFAEEARHALRRMIAGHWQSRSDLCDGPSRGRWPSFDEAEKGKRQETPDNENGERPGQNIEDVERSAMEHVMFGKSAHDGPFDSESMFPREQKDRKLKGDKYDTKVYCTSYGSLEKDYVIDPITNRKVARHPAPDSPKDDDWTLLKSFRENLKDCQSQSPIFHSGVPPAEELRKYGKVDIDPEPDDSDATWSHTGMEGGVRNQQPFVESEDYVRNHQPTETAEQPSVSGDFTHQQDRYLGPAVLSRRVYHPWRHFRPGGDSTEEKVNDLRKYSPFTQAEPVNREYHDLDKYKPVMEDELLVAEEPPTQYDDLHKYNPVMDEEPSHFEDLGPPSEELDKYTAIKHNEPDGKPASTAEESSRYYDPAELKKYKPVKWNEPDGKRESTEAMPQETAKKDAETSEYKPVQWEDPADEPNMPEQENLQDELSRYTAVRWNEPDVYWNEPLGQPPPSAEELSKNYDPAELKKYQQAVRWNEPDGKHPPSAEELSKNYTDLDKYGPVKWNEPDGKPIPPAKAATENYDDVDKYGPVLWNEPHGNHGPSAEELSKNYSDLSGYTAPEWNTIHDEVSTKDGSVNDEAELSKYGPVRYQEPDGKGPQQIDPVQEGLHEHDAHKDYSSAERIAHPALDNADELGIEVMRRMRRALETGTTEEADTLLGNDAHSAVEPEKSNYRKMLDSFMARYRTTSDAVDREASAAVKAKPKLGEKAGEPSHELTGDYIRDFPEEFEESWSTGHSPSKDTLAPASKTGANSESQGGHIPPFQTESQQMDGTLEGAFGEPSPEPNRIESALDRHTARSKASVSWDERVQAELDPYSKEPMGLETSYAEECGGKPTWPTYVKHYDSSHPKSVEAKSTAEQTDADAEIPAAIMQEAQETTSEAPAEPMLYKVLAYDTMMQKIEVAETTSVVPDAAMPLTPAEVLLRLSNPTKFFPYFAPLQTQGFEIVCGSGDVLVFRKVRPATEQGKPSSPDNASESSTTATAEPEATVPPINPIDMTGSTPRRFSPASANFASPTGFVNYDTLAPGAEEADLPPPPPAAPRFKSNIDVRREEPVFSGPKTEKPRKKSLSRRMVVGAAWVAGISYAIGVVSEYFATGGVDGFGPKGF